MPRVNTLLLLGVLLLVILFRSSSALASAYGIAVTGTMVVTSMLAFIVDLESVAMVGGCGRRVLIGPFLADRSDVPGANMLKVFEGGWMPLALGAVVMLVMYTWRRGSRILFEKTRSWNCRSTELVERAGEASRRSGCPAPPCSSPPIRESAPTALLHSLKHYKVLHERNVILTIETDPTPRVDPAERVRIEPIQRDVLRGSCCDSASWRRRTCRRRLRSRASSAGNSTSCRRRSSCRAARCGPPKLRACRAGRTMLFIALARTANDATDYFQVPTERVVEVGTQVTI